MRNGDKVGTDYNKALREYIGTLDKLKALREKFEGQRNRAIALRDGVRPEPHPSLWLIADTLSKAIQCECRRRDLSIHQAGPEC